MSFLRITTGNKKINLIKNRSTLKFKKRKIYINEAIDDIAAEQAFSVITEPVKSIITISEGIVKLYLSQVKLSINLLLLPLSKNLDSVSQAYFQDISEVNRLFTESIPANVQKTSQLVLMANNPGGFVFGKVLENLKKVEGITDVINLKNIIDAVLPDPLQDIMSTIHDTNKHVTSELWRNITKDLPDYFKIETSSYSSENFRTEKLLDLYEKLESASGGSYSASRPGSTSSSSSGDPVAALNILINDLRNNTAASSKYGDILYPLFVILNSANITPNKYSDAYIKGLGYTSFQAKHLHDALRTYAHGYQTATDTVKWDIIKIKSISINGVDYALRIENRVPNTHDGFLTTIDNNIKNYDAKKYYLMLTNLDDTSPAQFDLEKVF